MRGDAEVNLDVSKWITIFEGGLTRPDSALARDGDFGCRPP